MGIDPTPLRKQNGYRIYTDYHLELIKTARIAFQIEVLQSGLRERMREMIKALANYDFDHAQTLLDQYIVAVDQEIAQAEEAIHIVEHLLKGESADRKLFLQAKRSSKLLRCHHRCAAKLGIKRTSYLKAQSEWLPYL